MLPDGGDDGQLVTALALARPPEQMEGSKACGRRAVGEVKV